METNGKLQFVSMPDIENSSKRVISEYVFANHDNYQFWSRVKVVGREPKTVNCKFLILNSWKKTRIILWTKDTTTLTWATKSITLRNPALRYEILKYILIIMYSKSCFNRSSSFFPSHILMLNIEPFFASFLKSKIFKDFFYLSLC